MSTVTIAEVVGTGRDRVDGRLKVMGAATYPIDVTLPGLAHAVLVQSTVTSGRIRHIAVDAAERAPGVLAVITHVNAPALARGPTTALGRPSPLPPLQSDVVLHYGQHVAMVVAETREQAQAAAALIEVTYQPDVPVLAYDDPRASRVSHPWTPDHVRGDVPRALAEADVQVNVTCTTAENTNNPIGLFATVAVWDGDALTVHDTTQWPQNVRDTLAVTFGIDPGGVRVLAPFVGGAFGAGLRVWPHVPLAALAARVTKRPVKLVLTRAQMFTSIGHRPNSIQQLSLGASRDGQLTAIEHVSTSSIGMSDEMINLITTGTIDAYACPNVSTRAIQVRQSIPTPGWMRAPGEAEGSFTLESAIDELSYAVGIDPIELRVKNHAHVHPESGLPWSSNALLDCYRQGAERFGWSARNPKPRSMRNGGQLVGYGMARAALFAYQPPCKAIASIRRDGTVFVRSAATDIGTGTYTVMTMLAADCLGVPIERVQFGLGDSAMPMAPQQGGSGLTGALGNAVQAACVDLVRTFLNRVSGDEVSPIRGCRLEGITVRDGGIQITDDPARFETYADILTRHGLNEITVEAESAPPGETLVGHDGSPRRPLRPLHDSINGRPRARRCICRALRRGSRRSGSRNDPRRSSRIGRRWRQDSQPEDGSQSDRRGHRRRNRHGSAGGNRVGPYRPCGDNVAGRLCRGSERGRARCRRAVRGTTRFHDAYRNKGCRGTRHRRDGGSDRQRGLSRDGHAGPLVADLYRESARGQSSRSSLKRAPR